MFSRKRINYLLILIGVSLVLCGCGGDLDFREDNEGIISGTDVSEDNQECLDPEGSDEICPEPDETIEPEMMPSPIPEELDSEENNETSPEPDEKLVTIKVENLSVFINDTLLDYDPDNLETIIASLEKLLSSVSDDTEIRGDFRFGDNDIVSVIEEWLDNNGLILIQSSDEQ